MTISLERVEELAREYLLPLGLKLLLALAIFAVGRWISRIVLAGFDRLMERSKVDVSLRKFLCDVAYATLLVAVVIASLDTIGIKTTAVVAVLGAAGLAIGLALQGSLSNFAAGVMLIILRPYKVGDLVAIGKYQGKVDAIRVFQTVLVTGDNREVTIPNGQIIAAPIENMTVLGRRRLDLVVSVAQAADLHQLRKLLADVVAGDARVQQAPAPSIELAEITDASLKLHVRPWTTVEDYGQLATAMMERIKHAMDTAGLKYAVAIAPAG